LESRKYQLQKQIIEAQEAKDNELYSLLKSQWAHRFGVESLEELKNPDFIDASQKPIEQEHQKIDQQKDYFLEDDKASSIKDDNYQKKEINTDTNKAVKSVEINNKQSYEIVHKEDYENKTVNQVKEYKKPPEVKALIPLPPKPKYGYLKKWVL
tara:strand:+ start:315 stop:776 length:462 start_codon:yes stop_codon:yes gene_type:complete